jgi:hypothetical protein
MEVTLRKFNTDALYAALDAERIARDLSWSAVARQFWDLDAELNRSRPHDHPFSASTIRSMKDRAQTSCQHALFMLRWLDRAPEQFLQPSADDPVAVRLPVVPVGKRLRWSLTALYAAADGTRSEDGLTWRAAAERLGCQPGQLTGLRTATYATNINLAMRIVQWSARPSTDFMYFADW